MSKLFSQQDYWNSRAARWSSYDSPLIPIQQDLDFIKKTLVPGGSSLILGATPELCALALEVSKTVTAVDYAEGMLDALRIPGVTYVHMDWNEFLEKESAQYDNIMTDGGLICLEFPATWERIANNIGNSLRPSGVFAARVYVATNTPPQKAYKNPNLNRFITSMANVDANYMVHPSHPDYQEYDMRYALPPEAAVLKIFAGLALIDKLVPDYEAGEHFVSYAWQLTE